jgi:hypothetical protein
LLPELEQVLRSRREQGCGCHKAAARACHQSKLSNCPHVPPRATLPAACARYVIVAPVCAQARPPPCIVKAGTRCLPRTRAARDSSHNASYVTICRVIVSNHSAIASARPRRVPRSTVHNHVPCLLAAGAICRVQINGSRQ